MIKINLAKLLAERRMTQSELAEKTSIRPSTISMIYHGNCSFLKVEQLEKICVTLGCKIDEILQLL